MILMEWQSTISTDERYTFFFFFCLSSTQCREQCSFNLRSVCLKSPGAVESLLSEAAQGETLQIPISLYANTV